jgi:hypothetical protein
VPIHGGGNAGGGGNRTEPRSQPQLEGVFTFTGGNANAFWCKTVLGRNAGPRNCLGALHGPRFFKKSLLSLGF